MEEVSIRIDGLVPSKKNNKMMTRLGPITKPETQRRLAEIAMLMRVQYRLPRPLTRCAVSIVQYASNRRSDLDNAQTSILDCLKTAGVIQNDNMLHTVQVSSQAMLVHPGEEGVVITITGEMMEPKKKR